MLEDTPGEEPTTAPAETPADAPAADAPPAKKAAARKTAAKKATTAKKAPAKKAASKTTAKKTTARKVAAKKSAASKTAEPEATAPPAPEASAEPAPAARAESAATPPVKVTTRRRTTKKVAATPPPAETAEPAEAPDEDPASTPTALLFQPPDTTRAPARKPRRSRQEAPQDAAGEAGQEAPADAGGPADQSRADKPQDSQDQSGQDQGGQDQGGQDESPEESGEGGGGRRRRRRGGRRRRKSGGDAEGGDEQATSEDGGQQSGKGGQESAAKDAGKASGKDAGQDTRAGGKDSGTDSQEAQDSARDGGESPSSRRRRRRRRSGDDGNGGGDGGDDPQNTVTRVRQQRSAEDQITSLSGSTRLEAKKQRRREGREAGRRRAPIVSEAEFLARRESVDRMMAIRQREDLTQIAVLEDKVLVEHYVARDSQTSLIGNVYLGRVQNVLPSMEAAFIDIGKGRNAVLYAGEVNWSALGHREGQPRKIESVLSSGQPVLVQVTKDPVGHKGARLTSQISLAGRFLVYVPDGTNSGISRKLPDTERNRLKTLLKEIVPESAGVIVRTAAEGASEEELTRDVERLTARWADIEKRTKGSAPQLLYGEPDLTLKVVRDLFTEDFSQLVIQGEGAWETVQGYVSHVAPDLEERLERHDDSGTDIFAAYRVDEQIAKGLDRKVWLPSGGSLIIDRTEAMTVVDVNTGKFTGSGGNLEETVTKNNLEAAEEMVRQLRLRDIGGIIVIDFIDMVLESNRDLVLRRLVECLGRDRTRHQVAEVTSLGLVQMTRKRIGTGLLEAFSESCPHCSGRGLLVTDVPVEPRKGDEEPRKARRSRGGRGKTGDDHGSGGGTGNGSSQDRASRASDTPAKSGASPRDVAAMARVAEAKAKEGAEAPSEAAEATTQDSRDRQDSQDRQAGQASPDNPENAAAAATPEQPVAAAEQPETADRGEPSAEAAAEQSPPADRADSGDQSEPSAPATVTRTRRRSARRPAGPPAGGAAPTAETGAPTGDLGSVGSPPQSGAVEPGTADAEPAAAPVVEHVPVKKRGSRKR